jgi:hypothetical protein
LYFGGYQTALQWQMGQVEQSDTSRPPTATETLIAGGVGGFLFWSCTYVEEDARRRWRRWRRWRRGDTVACNT